MASLLMAVNRLRIAASVLPKNIKMKSSSYILSSGASYSHAYGFAICSLMEMQWLHAAPIHSGESSTDLLKLRIKRRRLFY